MRPSHVSFAARRHSSYNSGLDSAFSASPVSMAETRAHSPTSASVSVYGVPGHLSSAMEEAATERTALLAVSRDGWNKSYTETVPSSAGSKHLSRKQSHANSLRPYRYHDRASMMRGGVESPEFNRTALRTPRINRASVDQSLLLSNDRVWYDQFTSTDWVQDGIADGFRKLELRKRKNLQGRLWLLFDAAQGWILVAIIGCLTALFAYLVDISEATIFDLKQGYCQDGWFNNRERCHNWRTWSETLHPSTPDSVIGDYFGFVLGCVVFASAACFLTLLSRKSVSLQIASTFDENLGADLREKRDKSPAGAARTISPDNPPPMIYYSAAGSGVAEVKVILSGFVLHGYLGFKTLILKTLALIFSVASGMSLGKEGPFVHIATCIGNIACRGFAKYRLNDGKRREVLSAAAAGGVAVAFGAPIGGVLFSLEEVSYYFSPKTLFRTFFCCIAAALSLKFLNPYGTDKIVIFEVRYIARWHTFELFIFALLGILGGLAGAAFIKASRFWAKTFRRWKFIKSNPWFEVLLVALITGLVSFWNRYTKLSVTQLLLELASPCNPDNQTGLCPKTNEDIPELIGHLLLALAIKAFLTVITFGIKVPAGIYVPSMVCGGLLGRIVGHGIQYLILSSPNSELFGLCPASGNAEGCITPGVYALVAAGAAMCGVTRLSVTLAVILFELTGSLDHVLPFAIGVLTAKWTADLVEPYSIYDLLIDMNTYPFIDNKHVPLFDTEVELGDITPRLKGKRVIDVTISPYIRASELREKLKLLHSVGELDGGLPIIREKSLVGFIPAPDLEFALDRIEGSEEETLCLMSYSDRFGHASGHKRWFALVEDSVDSDTESEERPSSRSGSDATTSRDEDSDQTTIETDLVPFIDPAPVTLDVHSPMNLVFQMFSKLGLRYVCVVEGGEFRGMVHKKLFVKYLKTCEAGTE